MSAKKLICLSVSIAAVLDSAVPPVLIRSSYCPLCCSSLALFLINSIFASCSYENNAKNSDNGAKPSPQFDKTSPPKFLNPLHT